MSVRPVDGVDRRRILKAAAWSAPVIAVAVAAPAAAASGEVSIVAGLLIYVSDPTGSGSGKGPIKWAGATITWPADKAADASVSYKVDLTGPTDFTAEPLVPWSTVLLAPGGSRAVPGQNGIGSASSMPAGTYTVTLTVIADGETRLETASVVLVKKFGKK